MMKLSVVIPCLNAAATIGAQLEALARQQWDQRWEIVIADNGSTDDSLAIIERYRHRLPNLRVANATARRGQPYAMNIGARAAAGEALAFTDADDEVAPGWLPAIGEALSKYDCVACRIDFKKLNPDWLEEIVQDHEQQRSGLLKAWHAPYLWHAGGGTMGIKKSLHEAVGGFNESMRYCHDTDYCFKIQLKGGKIQFVPDALIHIRCRRTLPGLFHQARHWAEESVLLSKYYRSFDDKKRRPWRSFMRQCRHLLYSLPQTHYRAGRALWVWNLGWQLGRFGGSIKYRVPPV
jgi:glycosyltransferase involved in cell wall biosynthesis